MARRESDREDLLREATALVERAELQIAGYGEPLVAGFRRDGAVSIFFTPELVLQFNHTNELRRAFIGSLLYKAERGKLIALRRERSDEAVALVRTELSLAETDALLSAMQEHLNRLRVSLDSSAYVLLGQVPATADVPSRLCLWLHGLPEPIRIASAPGVNDRKDH
jgi:hypothetical protein